MQSSRLQAPFSRLLATDLLWSLCMALYYVFQFGYYFNRMDQEECLPLVYQLRNPALYPGDLYMDAAGSGMNIRFYFAQLVHAASGLMSVEHACFFLHVLCTGACAFFVMRIAGLWFPGNLWARLLAPFLVIGKYSFWVVGGNGYVDNQLVPHSVAVALCTAALYLFLRSRCAAAALLCGIGSLFQPLLGLQLALVLSAVLLCSPVQAKGWTLLRCGGVYLLGAAPLLLPLALRSTPPATAEDKQIFEEVYFFFRNRHHFIPSSFEASDWWHWGGLLALAAVMALLYRHPARRFLLLFSGAILLGMLLYTVLLQAGVNRVCYTQWFKTSLWLECLAALLIAGYVGKGLQLMVPWLRLRSWHWGAGLGLSLFFFLVVWGTPLTDLAGRRGWYELNEHPRSDLSLAHEWVRSHTPVQARILTIPRDESALSEMQRPLVFSYKAIVPEPWFMKRWYALYLELYAPSGFRSSKADPHLKEQEKSLYNSRDNQWFLARQPFDYRIVYVSALPSSPVALYRNDTYAVVPAH